MLQTHKYVFDTCGCSKITNKILASFLLVKVLHSKTSFIAELCNTKNKKIFHDELFTKDVCSIIYSS